MAQKQIAAAAEQRRADANNHVQAQIDRIDVLTRTARTTWFGLLSFLAFVSVALVGIEDADFFLADRETQLPLVGVAVPTLLFVALTPLLGSLLYAYFHMHLLKLWEALASAPAQVNGKPLSESITPWLVSDLALALRRDGALRHRPLRWPSHVVNMALAFWGTPLVLGAFWVWSFAPHNDGLTLVACGLPLIFSIYVGAVSWWRLRDLTRDKTRRFDSKLMARVLFVVVTLSVTTFGWLRVEGTFERYAAAIGIEGADIDETWMGETFYPNLLYSAQLQNVNFSRTPEDWVSRDLFRENFRIDWCKRAGVPAGACGSAPKQSRVVKADEPESWTAKEDALSLARLQHCRTLYDRDAKPKQCQLVFDGIEKQFEENWLRQRELAEAALFSFDFNNADLRRANLTGAQLQGANLFRAQLQGTNLDEAKFDPDTVLTAATFRGAAVRLVDFTSVPQIADHLQDLFGDASVILPPGVTAPDRFKIKYDGWDDFEKAWRAFQRSIGQDPKNPT